MGTKATIQDTLQDRVEAVLAAAKQALYEKIKNKTLNLDRWPPLSDILDVSVQAKREIIDHREEVPALFFFHAQAAEGCFKGVYGCEAKKDSLWPHGWKAIALQLLIETEVHQEYRARIGSWIQEIAARS